MDSMPDSIDRAESKMAVDVLMCRFRDGTTRPYRIRFEDERGETVVLSVDRLTGTPYPAASRKLGGRGICYPCVVERHKGWLLDEEGLWTWHVAG